MHKYLQLNTPIKFLKTRTTKESSSKFPRSQKEKQKNGEISNFESMYKFFAIF